MFAVLYTFLIGTPKNTGEKEHSMIFLSWCLFNNLISSIHDTTKFSISSFMSWKKMPFMTGSYSLAIIVHIKKANFFYQ